jgi:hypothetical protein
MKGKIVNLVMLMLAAGLLATPARADTLVKVTVRGPDGGPAAGVAVTIRQAAGYASAAGDVEPPAVVAAAPTGGDGTVNLRLASVRPYDVYSIGADDRASGRYASTAVFAGESRWPTPILTLDNRAPAINLERTGADEAAASCDRTSYVTHVENIHEAIVQQKRSLAALDNAIAQYARTGGIAASDLDAAQQQPGVAAADRAAMLRHYRLLHLLAENMRAGLDADDASAQGVATLEQCSNGTEAGVEMLARCPPGWESAQQNAAQSNCHRRSVGTGREQN